MPILGVVNLEMVLVVVEIVVLLFLIWHLRELAINSRDMHELIKEIHSSHQKLHRDTKVIRNSVRRLESDLNIIRKKGSKK